MLNILITGAAGYLGSMVLARLAADLQAHKINKLVATDLRDIVQLPDNVVFMSADICDKQRVAAIIEEHKITTIVHLAAIIDSTSLPPEKQWQIDVQATEQLLALAVEYKVQRIIISSSGAAYGYHADNPAWLDENCAIRGNDIFLYSRHKRMVEEILAKYRQSSPQLEQVVFRVGTILGEKTDNLITRLFLKKRILGVRGFASPFVFIWDQDAAEAFTAAVYSAKTGVFNLAGDGALRNADIARLMGKSFLAMPAALMRLFLRVGYALGLSQYTASQLLYIQYRPVLDNRRLKAEFGFTPTKNTLETFCCYLKAKGIAPQNIDKIELLRPD
jgi:UDP-glucose 4-epimerase